jgi:hypothetical protein
VETLVLVLGGVVGFAIGLAGGFFAGVRVREVHAAVYWLLNAVVFAIGISGNAYGLLNGQMWLVVASLAFIGGGVAGLKYGYAQVVGQWRRMDDALDAPEGDADV